VSENGALKMFGPKSVPRECHCSFNKCRGHILPCHFSYIAVI